MNEESLKQIYFQWLCGKAEYAEGGRTYDRLLSELHQIEFTWGMIAMDENRAADGMGLRYRFEYETGYEITEGMAMEPCSVLEMMVALAIRCEEDVMDDPNYGDRTNVWFRDMIHSMGLDPFDDIYFDRWRVRAIVDNMICRAYAPDGRGGLFTVPGCPYDMKGIDIWYQMMMYLDARLKGDIL